MQIIQNGRQQKRVRLRLFRHCQKRCKANLPAAREAHSLCLRRSALPFGFRLMWWKLSVPRAQAGKPAWTRHYRIGSRPTRCKACLLYTSDAADDLLCVDLGGRRIIKKKKN